jgi:hypothetical protein
MDTKGIKQEIAGTFIKRQLLFNRFTFFVLIDLTVLNLFAQYWENVYVANFTISLFTALLLQSLLVLTLVIEHRVASYFNAKPGVMAKVKRVFSAWAILFLSKLLILEAINFFFGSGMVFSGAVHGLVAFIVVVTAMIVAEQVVKKIYHTLD